MFDVSEERQNPNGTQRNQVGFGNLAIKSSIPAYQKQNLAKSTKRSASRKSGRREE